MHTFTATKRRGLIVTAVAISMVVAAELFARFYLGLGDPPLSVEDHEIEYLFKPGTYRRFGNTVSFNSHSMRSPEGTHFRVLVIGDSIVNGGAQTDQAELATTLLAQHLNMPVGNVSASSWGPANMLAYVKRFGLFDAERVIVVLSSHDYADAPTFARVVGVHPDFPADRPICALQEVFGRYAPRLVRGRAAATAEPSARDIHDSLAALRELLQLAKPRVIVAQHLDRDQSGDEPGHQAIRRVAGEEGVRVIRLKLPAQAYRDQLHPNALGQRMIAEQLAIAIAR